MKRVTVRGSDLFERLLNNLAIPKPAGHAGMSTYAAISITAEIGNPVVIRPSFVFG